MSPRAKKILQSVVIFVCVFFILPCLVIGYSIFRTTPETNLAHTSGSDRVRGAYHVHSVRSDGKGTEDEIAKAAHSAGMRFVVLTDHNKDPLPPRKKENGVWIFDGVEISTSFGHVVGLGIDRAPNEAERAIDAVDWVHSQGGEAYLAHPVNRRHPWRDPVSAKKSDGIEVFSFDTAFRDLLFGPSKRSIGAILAYPFAGDRVLSSVADFDPNAFALAETIGRERGSLVRLCSVDAHGFPSYLNMFRTLQLELDVTLSDDPSEAFSTVRKAIKEGRGRCLIRSRETEQLSYDNDVRVQRNVGPLAGEQRTLAAFELQWRKSP